MRKIACYAIFYFGTTLSFAQSNSPITDKHISNPNSSTWELDKYVWSHSHSRSGIKPLIDFDAIDNWVGLVDNHTDLAISPDGEYFTYGFGNYLNNRLDTLVIQSINNSWEVAFDNAIPGFFSADSKQYVFLHKEKGLCFLQIGTGLSRYIKVVDNYKLPPGAQNEWIVYRLQDAEQTVLLSNLITGKEKSFKNVSEYSFDNSGKWLVFKSKNSYKELGVYQLANGKIKQFKSVVDYLISKNGKRMLLKTEHEMQYVNLDNDSIYTMWVAPDTTIRSYNLDESGDQVIFISSMPSQDPRVPTDNTLWYWKTSMDKPVIRAQNNSANPGNDLFIQAESSFTADGKCIILSFQRIPDTNKPGLNAAQVDVWSYQDTILQAMQLYLVKKPIEYKALLNAVTGKQIWMDSEFEKLYYHRINNYVLVGSFSINGQPLKHGDRFWEKDYDKDSIWLISVDDGSRHFFSAKQQYAHVIKPSPDGQYLVYFDRGKGHYFSYNVFANKHIDISIGLPANQLGFQVDKVYWLPGDSSLLVYDDFDIWQLDPTGKKSPINLTNGYGRVHKILFRVIDEGLEKKANWGSSFFLEKDTLLLKAFDTKNKFNGYYRKVLGSAGNPELLYMGPYFMDMVAGTYGLNGGMPPLKAVNAKIWIIKRQSTTDAPNYFMTKNFKLFHALTRIQPHKMYNWLQVELHSFKRLDGTTAQGILYKPANFDATKKYPVIVSFYLTLSDRCFQYPQAQYIIAPNLIYGLAWIVSHDYLVFMPDLQFKKNQWGPSTVNTIDGAAKYLSRLSYIDGKHMGVCGHSNSFYAFQIFCRNVHFNWVHWNKCD
jgi:dipeptidyl aminopeptidase/acylaminoacyl peptidase